jgi:hypothetical protein
MGLLHMQQVLPMASLGPIDFLARAADALGWPHSIAAPENATDAQGWAHCICSRCCRGHRLGPLIFQQVLLMQRVLPMASLGPIDFLVGAADSQGWAHCFSRKCC